MEAKDFFTIGFSTLGLIVSATTLYLTQFRPANVTVTTGPMIHIFYATPDELMIYLPIVFHNESPTKAIVHKVFLEIRDTKGVYFALKWQGFIKIDLANNYTDTGLPAPFKIDGYEAIPNAIRFWWRNWPDGVQLDWLEGSYTMTLHVWTSDTTQPKYSVTENFKIDAAVAKLMADKKQKADNTSRFFPLEGKGLISFTSGKTPIDFSVKHPVR